MALGADEKYDGGEVRQISTGALVLTFALTGATMQAGFLRDPDGRLVVVTQ